MRMALDLGLHRALEKLADGGVKRRSDEEERDLGGYILTPLSTSSSSFICPCHTKPRLTHTDHLLHGRVQSSLRASGYVYIGSIISEYCADLYSSPLLRRLR